MGTGIIVCGLNGSGKSTLGKALAKKLHFHFIDIEKFVFYDSSDEMVRIVKERFQSRKAEFCVCDIQKLDYVNEFDVITAIQVNHYLHMDERRIALSKCYLTVLV